jgi:hypothetical protein
MAPVACRAGAILLGKTVKDFERMWYFGHVEMLILICEWV